MSAPCPILGFVVRLEFRDGVSDDESDAVIDEFVRLLERNGLSGGGGGDRIYELVVTRDGSQATEQDRDLVRAWALQRSRAAAVTVGELTDLNEAE